MGEIPFAGFTEPAMYSSLPKTLASAGDTPGKPGIIAEASAVRAPARSPEWPGPAVPAAYVSLTPTLSFDGSKPGKPGNDAEASGACGEVDCCCC